jgi:hypothetical protein
MAVNRTPYITPMRHPSRRLRAVMTVAAMLLAHATAAAQPAAPSVTRAGLASASASLQAQVQIVEAQRLDMSSTGRIERVRIGPDFEEYALTVSVRANVPWVLSVATPPAPQSESTGMANASAGMIVVAAADGAVARGTGPREVTLRWRTTRAAPPTLVWPPLALTVDAPQ